MLRCEVESLEVLHYKPQFADTFFHLTLYDGAPSDLAARALTLLREFPWRLRLVGEGRVVRRSPHAERSADGEPSLTAGAVRLIEDVFRVPPTMLAKWSDSERIEGVKVLAELIHNSDQVQPLSGDLPARSTPFSSAPRAAFVQEAFWSSEELPGASDRIRESRLRADTGTVLTPPELAIEMAREALRHASEDEPISFVDPAIGTGMLFAALRRELGQRNLLRAVGFESNEDRGRQTAYRWRRSGMEVLTGDFLSQDLESIGKFNLLLANPPYVRYEKQDRDKVSEATEKISLRVGVSIPVRSNLFVHFVLAADALMASGGVAAWILPADFMTATYAKGLRQYLARHVTLIRVHQYDTNEKVFDNARISPAIVIFRKALPPANAGVDFTYGGTPAVPFRAVEIPRSQLSTGESWGSLPAAYSEGRRVGTTVGDYFTVRRGLATGGNSFFILSDGDRAALGVPDDWVRPVLPKSRYLDGPIIHGDAAGVPLIPSVRWLIDSSGSAEDIRVANPRFAAYLDAMPDEVRHSSIVSRRRRPLKQEGARPAPFVFVAMARQSEAGGGREMGNARFYWNMTEAVALNNFHTLHPREEIQEALDSGVVSHADILESLSRIQQDELSRVGRLHASGLLKLEPGDVRALRWTLDPTGISGMLEGMT